jgi:hypothetical protein
MYNNLINDYIKKVTKNMGSNQRNEVARELKTHILDSADAFAAERNVEIDENIIREVIGKMGPAEEVAAMYPVETTLVDIVKDTLQYSVRFIVIIITVIILSAIASWIYFDLLHYPPSNIFSFYGLNISVFTILIIFIALIILITIRLFRRSRNQP